MHASGTTYALKFLDCREMPPALVANEVRVLIKLREVQHPNIIQLHDVCALPGYLVLRMQKADGNLFELEDAYRELTGTVIPPDHVIDLLEQAAMALDFLAAHPRQGDGFQRTGLQHCDIKPSNLLVMRHTLKIADFGLCRSALAHTHRRRMMGTPPYAAPELYEGNITSHTDQYALAMTYCVLVPGERVLLPFEPGIQPRGLPVDLARMRNREAPILARALDPCWTNRWPSCMDFINALKSVVLTPRRSGVQRILTPLRRTGQPVHAS